MNTKNVVIGVLAAVVVYDGIVSHRNHKTFNKLRDSRNKIKKSQVDLKRQLINANRRAQYLAVKLDKLEVPITEFEEIIFTNFK